jgi:uncharacterized protein YegL
LNLAIVIDCSGSMQGDSMEQAKQALEGILDGLQSHDRITLIAFGNTTSALSDRPLACNKTNLTKAKRFAKALDANMGGTEIGKALRKAYSIAGEAASADIFLVTDGEVSEWASVVDEAKKSRNRIFTVGVGSAVSEAFVRQLAADTGGECELVSPREGMADRVVRHFERMRAPRAKRVVVRWPEGAKHIHPSRIGAVFEGDTVVACARFDQPLQHGSAILEVETDKGEVVRQELKFPKAMPAPSPGGISMVARVTAAAGLPELDDVAGLDTALRYQLVSRWTNWLVIALRTEEDKVQDIPALRKVPQTLAAGWGGVGSVDVCLSMAVLADPIAMYSHNVDFAKMGDLDRTEVKSSTRVPPLDLPETYRRLLMLVDAHPSRLDVAGALDLLMECGLEAEFEGIFRHATDLDLNIKVIAAIVLARLLDGRLGEFLSRDAQVAFETLQERAKEATFTLSEIARQGIALARMLEKPVARELLRHRANDDALERFVRIRELLEHLEHAVRRSGEHLEQYRNDPARRTARTIV